MLNSTGNSTVASIDDNLTAVYQRLFEQAVRRCRLRRQRRQQRRLAAQRRREEQRRQWRRRFIAWHRTLYANCTGQSPVPITVVYGGSVKYSQAKLAMFSRCKPTVTVKAKPVQNSDSNHHMLQNPC